MKHPKFVYRGSPVPTAAPGIFGLDAALHATDALCILEDQDGQAWHILTVRSNPMVPMPEFYGVSTHVVARRVESDG